MIRWLKMSFFARRLRTADCDTLEKWAEIDPPVTDWDVAQAAEQREPGRVEYRFLGVTGEEDA